jgi:hypothetical protein
MEVASVVCSVILAVTALAWGIPKVQDRGLVAKFLRNRGLGSNVVRGLGGADLLAVVGLMVGLFWRPAGIAAAALLVLLFGWGVSYHFMYGDYAEPEIRRWALVTAGVLNLAVLTLIVLLLTQM